MSKNRRRFINYILVLLISFLNIYSANGNYSIYDHTRIKNNSLSSASNFQSFKTGKTIENFVANLWFFTKEDLLSKVASINKNIETKQLTNEKDEYVSSILMHLENILIKSIYEQQYAREILINRWYSIRNNTVYFQEFEMPFADPETLIGLTSWYAKDKNNVYSYRTIIKDADTETFKIFEQYDPIEGKFVKKYMYAEDKNNIYFNEKIIDWADIETFKIIDWHYSQDKNNSYFQEKKIGNNFFVKLNENYTKDDSYVYYRDEKIEWADAITFKVIAKEYWQDKNRIYSFEKKLEIADKDSFEILDYGYAKDKNYIYNYGDIIYWAERETFKLIDNWYASDINFIYLFGIPLGGEKLDIFYDKYPKYKN